MNPLIAAWVAGFRLGHDGKAPAISGAMLERELKDIESYQPGAVAGDIDHDWVWHMMGWSAGQGIAVFEIGKL